jgi:hypothetical protein
MSYITINMIEGVIHRFFFLGKDTTKTLSSLCSLGSNMHTRKLIGLNYILYSIRVLSQKLCILC